VGGGGIVRRSKEREQKGDCRSEQKKKEPSKRKNRERKGCSSLKLDPARSVTGRGFLTWSAVGESEEKKKKTLNIRVDSEEKSKSGLSIQSEYFV